MDLKKFSKAVYKIINEAVDNSNDEFENIIASANLKVSNKNTPYYIKLYKKFVTGAAGWSSQTKDVAYSGVIAVSSKKRNSNLDTISENIKTAFESLKPFIRKSYGTVDSYEYYDCYIYGVNEQQCNEIRLFVRSNGE